MVTLDSLDNVQIYYLPIKRYIIYLNKFEQIIDSEEDWPVGYDATYSAGEFLIVLSLVYYLEKVKWMF